MNPYEMSHYYEYEYNWSSIHDQSSSLIETQQESVYQC